MELRARLLALALPVTLGCGVDEVLLPFHAGADAGGDAGAAGGPSGSGGAGSGGAGSGGAGAGGADAGGGLGGESGATDDRGIVPEPELKVALFGDQGLSPDAEAVLDLVAAERADLVLHLGDFDYIEDPVAWEAQIDAHLGPAFPYFATVGNHDVGVWDEYQERLWARLARVPGALCVGDLGVRSACRYRGLYFVLSGVGTLGADHEPFLEQALAATTHIWKICAWHKNQHDMQTGWKTDEVGWEAYQICQDGGALIATAHEHAYARTFTLNNLGQRVVQHGALGAAERLTVTPGRTFVSVSGLGGHSIRPYAVGPEEPRWWATVYTSDVYVLNGKTIDLFEASPGALFFEFHVEGDPRRGRGYFKNIRGRVIDRFEMVAGAN